MPCNKQIISFFLSLSPCLYLLVAHCVDATSHSIEKFGTIREKMLNKDETDIETNHNWVTAQ